MAQLIFPPNPTDGQEYVGGNGITYVYKSAPGVWTSPTKQGPDFLPGSASLPVNYTAVSYDSRSKIWSAGAASPPANVGPPGLTVFYPLSMATSLDGAGWTLSSLIQGTNIGQFTPGPCTQNPQGSFIGTDNKLVWLPPAWVAGSPTTPVRGYKMDGYGGTSSYVVDYSVSAVYPAFLSVASKSGPGGIALLRSGTGNFTVKSSTDNFVTCFDLEGTFAGETNVYFYYLPKADKFIVAPPGGGGRSYVGTQAPGTSAGMTFVPSNINNWAIVRLAENGTGGVILATLSGSNDYIRSTDGGVTFTAVSAPTPPSGSEFIRVIWFVNGAFYTFACEDNFGLYLYKSLDGTSFSQVGGNLINTLNLYITPSTTGSSLSDTDGKKVIAYARNRVTGVTGLYEIPSSVFV